ncbi:hypothetical protein ACFX5E_12945 [Flavobacterium sp. LS2P90]|uniref:Uncharacterized protein n=1 Tax=Flavobacterium xylosi TaxID=3230415 RepID=A0ABW6HZJ4_9FLAO
MKVLTGILSELAVCASAIPVRSNAFKVLNSLFPNGSLKAF